MKYLNIGSYLLLAFLIIFPFTLWPRIIKIQRVKCYSQYGICEEEIFLLFGNLSGQSLRDAKINIKEKLKQNLLVEKFALTFRLPGTLRVDVILKKAKFALVKKDSPGAVLLDKDGNVLQKSAKTNLPQVMTTGSLPAVGEKVAPEKLFALNLVYSLNFYYQVNSGEITKEGLVVKLSQGSEVIFPLAGDKEILLASLKLILSRPEGAKLIDLRFKNPIIK